VSCVSQLPAQQSHDELQDIVLSLQTSPSGLHPIGLRQIPIVSPALMTHVTGLRDPPGRPVEPQQSPSLMQRSPTTWQPLAGWQTKTPVGPHGAQARLQQAPPQAGKPPSVLPVPLVPAPPQSWPSSSPQLAGPPGALAAQVPTAWFAAMLHVPVQQPEPTEQASPGCAQKEDAWHVPLAAQCFEQHVASEVQLLPTVEQLELRAVHVPPAQFWLQHWPLDVHAALSAVHAGYWHTPLTQSALQQSPFAVHPAPSLRQAPLPVKTPGKSAPGPPGPLALPEAPEPPPEPCPFPEPPTIKKLPEPAPPSPPTRFDVCAPHATTTASAMAPKSATPVRF